MNRSLIDRPSGACERVLVAACLIAVLLVLAVPAGAASVVHFKQESYAAFQRQLGAAQIHAATFNKKAHTLHVTLADGHHFKAGYPSHDEAQIATALRAKGASVQVKRAKQAKAVKHTLRYVAGGIMVIVILAILTVLLIGRRRALAPRDPRAAAQPTPAQPPPAEQAPAQSPETSSSAAPPLGSG